MSKILIPPGYPPSDISQQEKYDCFGLYNNNLNIEYINIIKEKNKSIKEQNKQIKYQKKEIKELKKIIKDFKIHNNIIDKNKYYDKTTIKRQRYKLCIYDYRGLCKKGDQCSYAHGESNIGSFEGQKQL